MSILLTLNKEEAEIVISGLMCLGNELATQNMMFGGVPVNSEYHKVMQLANDINQLVEMNV